MTAPGTESKPPSTQAGIAAKALSATVGATPGAGKEVRKTPATAASTPASAQPVAAVRESRMPISEAVGPSAAAARMPTPRSGRGERDQRAGKATTGMAGGATRAGGSGEAAGPGTEG